MTMSIGEFARLGGVSVRMLRHYDAGGLLAPARVDPASGYRTYDDGQLPRLHRITALTALGLTLRQVRAVVDDDVPPPDLSRLLTARRTELEARLAADARRLREVEARLRAVEAGAVATHDTGAPPFALRPLASVRLAQVSAVSHVTAADRDALVARSLVQVAGHLRAAGVEPAGPPTVHARPLGDGALLVGAGVVVDDGAVLPDGVEEERLPAVPLAACVVVAGSEDDADADLRTLAWWLRDNGYRYALDAPVREVHLAPPAHGAVAAVELQLNLVRA